MTDGERKDLAWKIRTWHRHKKGERVISFGQPSWRPISFEELARDVESGAFEKEMQMAVLTVVLEGDGKFKQLDPTLCHRTEKMTITALEGGMKSGNPSVALIVELDDGKWVFAETSLKLFLAAADAFKAKYGDPRQDAAGSV